MKNGIAKTIEDSRFELISWVMDKAPCMWIRCINPVYPMASIEVASNDIKATTDWTTAYAQFTSGSTPGTVDTAQGNADTLGELVDTINNFDDWEAGIIGGLRADATSGLATLSECAVYGVDVLVYQDSSVIKAIDVCVGWYGHARPKNFRAELYWLEALLTPGENTVTLMVYECDDRAKSDTLLFTKIGGNDGVSGVFPDNGPTETPIHVAKVGNRIVVRASTSTSSKPSVATDRCQVQCKIVRAIY